MLVWRRGKTLVVEPRGTGTSYKTFIDLLTTVHFISVLTAFCYILWCDSEGLAQFAPVCFFFFYIYMFSWEMPTASAAQCTNQNYSSSSSLFFFLKSRHSQLQTCRFFRRSFPCARKHFHDSPLGGPQTFSRNIDKIQMKKKRGGDAERFQQLSSDCLRLVCRQRKSMMQFTVGVTSSGQKQRTLPSAAARCCQLRSKGQAKHETFPIHCNLTR